MRDYEFHGLRNSNEYGIWNQMKNRCYNPKVRSYVRYGARGITVCDRWRDSFANFYEDMGPRPSPEYSLDRKDTNGHYCKENCQWSTQKHQQQNRRDNVILTHNGESHTISEWERLLGFSDKTIRQRINKLGWDVAKALTTPTRSIIR